VSVGARLASPRLTRDRLTRTLLLALERCCDAAKVTTDVKTERSYAEKENRVAQSMDQGRHSRTQGAFESANVCREGRQGDETDRRGGAAEGNDDRHRPRSPTLTTSPVCPYGLGSVIVITGAIVRLSQCVHYQPLTRLVTSKSAIEASRRSSIFDRGRNANRPVPEEPSSPRANLGSDSSTRSCLCSIAPDSASTGSTATHFSPRTAASRSIV
jgi:hypothetical protein